MQRKTRKIIGAVAVIGALAAGGAAFTSSSSLPNTIAGVASSTITGANANSLTYTYDGTGTHINGVNLIFNEDLTAGGPATNGKAATITSAFNGGSLASNCSITLAGYDGTGLVSPTPGKGTHVLCDYSGSPQAVANPGGANSFQVAVVTTP